jgi:hypothetical protein
LISVANGFEVQRMHSTIFIIAVFPLCICFHLMVLLLCFLYRTHIMCCYVCSPVLQKSTDVCKCKEMPTRIILWTMTEARANLRNTVRKVGQIKDTVTMMHYAGFPSQHKQVWRCRHRVPILACMLYCWLYILICECPRIVFNLLSQCFSNFWQSWTTS